MSQRNMGGLRYFTLSRACGQLISPFRPWDEELNPRLDFIRHQSRQEPSHDDPTDIREANLEYSKRFDFQLNEESHHTKQYCKHTGI